VWLVAVALWLFDLKFVIISRSSKLVYACPGIQGEKEAEVIFT
jgi:hypothetical protein